MTCIAPIQERSVLAFHGDAAIKEKYLARVRAHRAADELIAGATGQGGKGCAVWCTFDAYDHARGPLEIGVPTELMELNDFIFESLPRSSEAQMGWPERFLVAPKPGADLRLVWDRFTLWILTEEHPDRGEHCARMGSLFERHIAGDTPMRDEWDRAARDARAALDAWDARAAWDARDARAAWDALAARAAWADRDALAARAAWDARDARDALAARAASISRMADKLIQLMSEAA